MVLALVSSRTCRLRSQGWLPPVAASITPEPFRIQARRVCVGHAAAAAAASDSACKEVWQIAYQESISGSSGASTPRDTGVRPSQADVELLGR